MWRMCEFVSHEWFKIKSIGISYILYVHLDHDTSPFMMNMDAYTMMMMIIIMPYMIFEGLLYLQTYDYSQLARPCRPRGCASSPGGLTLACVGPCIEKYYTSKLFGLEVISTMVLNDRFLIMIACIFIPRPQNLLQISCYFIIQMWIKNNFSNIIIN